MPTQEIPAPDAAPPIVGERMVAPPSSEITTPADPIPVQNLPSDLPTLAPYLYKTQGMAALNQPRAPVPPPASSDAVRVAILLPLSGTNSRFGQAMLNAAELALFDFADTKFELIVHDTKGTSRGAAEAASLAIGDGARLILGPLLAGSVRAAAPAAQAANVPISSFSSDVTVAGDGVYVMGFAPGVEVERVIGFASSSGLQRFAALVPDNAEGQAVITAFRDVTSRLGAEISAIQYYDPNATDFTAPIRVLADYDARRKALMDQIKELEARDDDVAKQAMKRLEQLHTIGDLPYQALLLADGGKRLQSVAALLPFFDIDPSKVQMLGTGRWDVASVGTEPALVGGWYAAPPPKARLDFEKRYTETFKSKPPRLATLAYDSLALSSLLAQAEGGADFSPATIMSSSGYWGRDGIFRFRPEGVIERGLSVLKVERGANKVISAAPDSFQGLVN